MKSKFHANSNKKTWKCCTFASSKFQKDRIAVTPELCCFYSYSLVAFGTLAMSMFYVVLRTFIDPQIHFLNLRIKKNVSF